MKTTLKMINRIISAALSAALAVTFTACKNIDDTTEELSSTATSDISSAASVMEEPFSGIYFDTDVWQAVPLVTQAMLDRGIAGGEGCQAVLYTAFSPNGKVVLMGTDVGGIYKSTDAGDSWYPSGIGLESSGGTGFCFDPKNENRVICAGSNSGAHEFNGIYLSEDAGDSWSYVYHSNAKNFRNAKSQLAWDETSYDESIGGCAVAYWSRERSSDSDDKALIYRTTDGAKSWKPIENSKDYADGYIFVNAKSGAVAAGNNNGIFISNDGGSTFKNVLDKRVLALDYVRTTPNTLYATVTDDGYGINQLAVSIDFGKTWTFTDMSMSYPCYLRVSPVNTNRMVVMDDTITKSGKYPGYVYSTENGGETWTKAERNSANSTVPANSDNVKFAWSPTSEKTVLASWCFMCKSTDGGKNFAWSNTGYNGICTAGMTNFNVNNSDYIYYASQDYNGAFSTDGGKAWKYMAWDGKGWGGWTYGGYAINKSTVVTGVAQRMFGSVEMWITYDGGKTYKSLGLPVAGKRVGCGVIGNDKIAFFGEYRTTDGGYSWKKMNGCDGVYTVDYSGSGALFGVSGNTVVVSTDSGATWKSIISAVNPKDLAYNYKTRELFVCTGFNGHSGLDYQLNSIKLDDQFGAVGYLNQIDFGQVGAATVCVDPKNPDIMYVGCSSTYYFNLKSVWRSLDGGRNFTCMSRQKGDGRLGPDGGRKPTCMRVNGNTGEMFVFSGCRGVWKLPAPPKEYYN